ncbi:MAG: shikimate dehydrogenase [Anaerolineae bacterium]|nr:MAG: shikimate dehydrogenase [Anaerolineae bacterium]
MDRFAFMIHPADPKEDVARKFPLLGRYVPESVINYLCRFFPPLSISHIRGVRSASTGKEVEGWFVACPLTPVTMMSLPMEKAYRKIIQTGQLAEQLGARIVGLGAFTKVVGDAGVTVSKNLNIAVTTGNSYTVALAVQGILEAARRMEIPPTSARVAVVGATGSIGAVCAQILARSVAHVLLVGRRAERLKQVCRRVEAVGGAKVGISTEIQAIRQADLVVTVTSAVGAVIDAHHLKSGAVVCDVARPRDVSRQVIEARDDVLVIEGGLVTMPGKVDLGFDYGLPHHLTFGCMAETMALALEGRFENYSLGRDLTIKQVDEIAELGHRHGFHLAGFRSFEHVISDEEIETIKRNAHQKRSWAGTSFN